MTIDWYTVVVAYVICCFSRLFSPFLGLYNIVSMRFAVSNVNKLMNIYISKWVYLLGIMLVSLCNLIIRYESPLQGHNLKSIRLICMNTCTNTPNKSILLLSSLIYKWNISRPIYIYIYIYILYIYIYYTYILYVCYIYIYMYDIII